MLTSILLFIVALSVLIVVHEAGHYLAARWMGVHVEVFSIGYGKRLFGKNIGGTDFRVSIFPLGGYAKMYGDITEEVAVEVVRSVKKKGERKKTPDAESKSQSIEIDLEKSIEKEKKPVIPPEKSFFNKKRWQRVIILLSGVVFNILLAIVLVWIVNLAGREAPAYKTEPPVLGGVVDGSPAAKAGLKAGDRILAINNQRMKIWEEVEIKVMINPKDMLRIRVDRAGEEKLFHIQPVEVSPNRVGYIGLLSNIPLYVSALIRGSEAERIGLKTGDIIRKINDIPIHHWLEGVRIISENAGKPLELTVDRGGKEIVLNGTPAAYKDPKTGKVQGKLGFSPAAPMRTFKYGLIDGFTESIKENIRFAGLFYVSITKLITGKLSIRSMSGPIEITRISVEVASQGALPLVFLMGFISLNLGLFNILPIPLFDGGAILILFIESIRRKDFRIETKEKILQIGFFFIVALVAVVFYFDILKIFF